MQSAANPARIATIAYQFPRDGGIQCRLVFVDGTAVDCETAATYKQARLNAERKLSEDYPGFTAQG